MENKVLINGVTQTGMRGLPQDIIQAAQMTRKVAMAVWGTEKEAAILL
jgi:hypothetical protein